MFKIISRKAGPQDGQMEFSIDTEELEGTIIVGERKHVSKGCHFQVIGGDEIGLREFPEGSGVTTNDGMTEIEAS